MEVGTRWRETDTKLTVIKTYVAKALKLLDLIDYKVQEYSIQRVRYKPRAKVHIPPVPKI